MSNHLCPNCKTIRIDKFIGYPVWCCYRCGSIWEWIGSQYVSYIHQAPLLTGWKPDYSLVVDNE